MPTPEIKRVSESGFWLTTGQAERYLAFEDFLWFREAAIGQLLIVILQNDSHLYWSDLDVDLAVQSIDHPEWFPLISSFRDSHPGFAPHAQ